MVHVRPLRATAESSRSAGYRRPGGPWDVGALDEELSALSATVTIADPSIRLEGGDLERAVVGAAGCLADRGAGEGSVVSWQLPNGVDAWLLYRACWRLGATAAAVHHAAGAADVVAAHDAVSPDVLLSLDELGPHWWRREGPDVASGIDPGSIAVVLFTSGSSGRPKAVMHTHRGLVSKARTMASVHGLRPEDVVLMPAPMAHISGLLNGLLVPGVAGMSSILMPRWDPDRAVELIEQERVTFMIGPPTFFVSLMSAPAFSGERVASLRLVSSGGAGVTPAFVTDASAALGCRVKRTYGSTEMPTVTTSGPGDPDDRARDSDGRVTGEAEVRICDAESRQPVSPETVGEVWLRGPELFAGYVDAAATEAAFVDGWFRSGDLGWLDASGWLTICGRLKDVIIRGGENITASEVEAVLEAHPDVRQAAVVGYPDARLGQRVCAFVVTSAVFDLGVCREWMAARGVTKFKWPERIVAVGTLPMLAAGKIDRAALAEIASQRTDATDHRARPE